MSQSSLSGYSERRTWLLDQVANGRLGAGDLAGARVALGLVPGRHGWMRVIGATLLATGIALLAAAAIFAVAFNWDRLGHFSRFAILEGLLVASVLGAWWRGAGSVAGESLMIAAVLLTGALLALFGQTYQTGADPYSLFVVWAVLILPWCLHARWPAAWLIWLVVANVGLALFCHGMGGDAFFWRLFGRHEAWFAAAIALNGLLVVAFELMGERLDLGGRRIVPRVALLAVLLAATAILLPALSYRPFWARDWQGGWQVLLAGAAFALTLWWTYLGKRDLPLLAATTLAGIGIGFAVFMRIIGPANEFGVLLISAAYWIGLVSAAVVWLRGLAATKEST
ncbi:MAG: DUF2157 domain-containing protein [Burkholderiales bacterium]